MDNIDSYNAGLVKLKTIYKHTKLGIRAYTLYIAFFKREDQYNYNGPFVNIVLNDINKNPKEITNNYKACLWSEYGYTKDDSKLTRTAMITFNEGKNAGKKNETSTLQQAINEALSRYDKKIQEGMTPIKPIGDNLQVEKITESNKADTSKLYYLMAAYDFKKVNSRILKFPCVVQKKLDGLRAGARFHNNIITMYSRARKEFTLKEHIDRELKIIFDKHPNWFLDGEFYNHGVSLQTINSLVKNPEKGDNLEYHIFDCFHDFTRPLMLRVSEDLEAIRQVAIKHNFKYVKIVESSIANNIKDVDKLYNEALDQRYEGVMLKNLDGIYEASLKREVRSHNILKYKPFYDSEFKIMDAKDGKGKEEGAIIFILETNTGKQFSARPRDVDTETRKKLYTLFQQHPEKFVGKMATIMYDALSDSGVPQRLRFKNIRDESWDMLLNKQ